MRLISYPISILCILLLISCTAPIQKEVTTPLSQKEDAATSEVKQTALKISSSAFEDNTIIPEKYSCNDENINPPLSFDGIPDNAVSLVLIIDDPDAPRGTWDHWILFNIHIVNKIEENSIPGMQGVNSRQTNNYIGPCPPSGTHRYFFKLYALDTMLELDESAKKIDVEKSMEGHILDKTQLIGLFSKT